MALTELFIADLATTTVSSGGTTAPSSGATETWTVASSAMFGAAATGVSQFHVADALQSASSEVIAVTNVSGTTWSVTRGADGTTPVAHVGGFTVIQVVTEGFLATVLTTAGGAVSGSLSTTPVTLTDASSITVNAALSDVFRVTLGGNRTLANPSNPADGQAIVFEVIQDATGSRTLAYGTAYSFPASIGTPVLSTTPAYHDFIAFRYDASTTTWYCVGFVPQAVNATPATVAQGGTGLSSLTAYALLAGGTTSTGAVQQVTALGTSGWVLTSNGAGALPTFQAASSGFSNPMTTLGDLIYENATPAAARLAADMSNTRKFLRTQASGGVGQAPAWDTLVAGDLPAATTSAQGAVILDGTASDITATGTAAAAGAVGKAADAGHTHANSLAIPGDFSFAGWTFDPGYCSAANVASTSLMYLVRFFLRQATTLNDVWLHIVANTTGTLTSGQNFACVYDSGGTQRAITADQSTAWATTGVKEAAFTSPYSAPAGWYYFVMNLVVSGGAGPTFRAATTTASNYLMNAGLSAATLRVASQAAVAGTPGALTLSSNVQTNSFPVCAVFV